MEKNIYADIATRTQGDIYVGVVGPVRTGKSTFISKFVNTLVVPKISNKSIKQRTLDELPQSASGNMVMTTQPKFVPETAVKLELEKGVFSSVRLVDCVGYLVSGATGTTQDGKPRMVNTPWSDAPITFEKAAEIGTNKVIAEHSTIGVVVTCDGTICDIARQNYVEAESRVIEELLELKKPFVVVVNSKNPEGEQAMQTKNNIVKKFGVPCEVLDVANMTEDDILNLFEKVLFGFPMARMDFDLPDWAKALDGSSSLIVDILQKIEAVAGDIQKIGDFEKILSVFEGDENVVQTKLVSLNLGTGVATFCLDIKKELFYAMLSEKCEEKIENDFALMKYLKQVSYTKKAYEKLESALKQVEQTGYGVVVPSAEELVLEDPQIVKKGNTSAVKLKATAPSLHIMRVDVETEIVPQMSGENTGGDMAGYLVHEFENNPQGIWNTNMFGKPLSVLAGDGIASKLYALPEEAQIKMRKTLTKIVNENKGGIICILL